jgi:hypothetical protein
MMARILARADAKAHGLTRYYTGKPCGRGHIAERNTSAHGYAGHAINVEQKFAMRGSLKYQ